MAENREQPVRVGHDGDAEISRSDLLRKGVLAAGAIYGATAVSPYVRRALATTKGFKALIEGSGELNTLNFLLMFEYMQEKLYSRMNSEINDKGEKLPLKTEEKEMVELLLGQDREHVEAIKKLIEELGGKPVDQDEFAFAFAFRYYESFLVIAGEIETSAVGAYNGAIPSLESERAREVASSIVQVDGRHAATVLIANNQEPAPEAFDIGIDKSSSFANTEQFTGAYYE